MAAYVTAASVSDAIDLAPRLRDEDVAEIRAASGLSPLAALTFAVEASDPCLAVRDDDHVVIALFGVTPHPDRHHVGVMWMLGSDKLFDYRRQLIRESPKWIARLHARYPILWNLIDERNDAHVRYIKHVGCHIINRHEHAGVAGIPFLEFIHVPSSSRNPNRDDGYVRRRIGGDVRQSV